VKRAGSYSRNRPDPVHYSEALREVLDIVDEHVAPGPVRDRYYVHWYRGKVLKRLGEGGVLDAPAAYRRALYDEARKLAADRFGAGVERLLRLRMRVRSALLRAGARDELCRLLEGERGAGLDTVLDGLRWDGDRLVVRFTAGLAYRDGTPFAVRDGRWVPPVPLALPDELLDATDEWWRLDLYIRRRADGADHPLRLTARAIGELKFTGEATLDPDEISVLTPGTWDLVARLDAAGWIAERRLGGAVALPARGRLVPYRTDKGNVSVRVRAVASAPSPLKRAIRRIPGARRAARRLLR
jgi:hypothetical protein